MKHCFIAAVCLFSAAPTIAQTPAPDVSKLVVNSSPAYILLGVQPDNIQRPSTPREFMGGVQSALVNKQLQPNFALETNPFNWNRKTKSNQFYANDYFYEPGEAIKKNLAISLATSNSDTVVFGKLRPGLGLGYGVRVTILPGKINKEVADAFYVWEEEEIKSIFLNLLFSDNVSKNGVFTSSEIDKRVKDTKDHVETSVANRRYILPGNKDKVFAALDALANTYKAAGITGAAFTSQLAIDRGLVSGAKIAQLAVINASEIGFERQGFILEFAAAGVTVFQENKWANAHHGKTAIWLSPSYRFNVSKKGSPDQTQSLDIMSVLRYIWNESKVDTASYFDFGAKIQYNKVAWNASFEWTARHASKVPADISSNWTNCWLLSFNYTINQFATLKFSFGSNFDGNTTQYTSKKDMFAVGGVNLAVF
jgi:hypothetical protein